MRKVLLGLGLLGSALTLGGEALACGDKLVVVGRGVRPSRTKAPHRGAVLLYANPGGSVSAIAEEGRLKKDLERAGHRVRSVATEEDLRTALRTGTYDLLLADMKTVPQIEGPAQAAQSKPTVLPTLYKPSDAELAAAHAHFACVLKSPSSQQDYVAVVNEALALRAKQSQPPAKK